MQSLSFFEHKCKVYGSPCSPRCPAWQYGDSQSNGAASFVFVVYPIPNPYRSDKERERFLHRDLDVMTLAELRAESACLRFAITLADRCGIHGQEWRLQRQAEIEQRMREEVARDRAR